MAFGSVISDVRDAPEARKRRGAFFTPPELADYLAGACIVSPSDRVLEPACGEAEFLRAAFARLQRLGCSPDMASSLMFGCELHAESAEAGLERMRALGCEPRVEVGDFFDIAPADEFDAVIGNPPYVRYQGFAGEEREKALAAARRAGVGLSALSSSWAPFAVLCARALRSGGALGLVLPAELLTVNYAAPVRRMLLGSFRRVELTLFEERVFPEVQEEVVALVASGFREGAASAVSARRARGLADIGSAPVTDVAVPQDGSRWSSLLAWTGSAGADGGPQQVVPDGFCALGDWGTVFLGAVTGNNKYFALTAVEAGRRGLGAEDSVMLAPPGSRRHWGFSLGKGEMADLDWRGLRTRLFYPSPPEAGPSEEGVSDASRAYIALGEAEGVPAAYKCRARSPWWRVPMPRRRSDLLLTYMSAKAPQLCSNDAGAAHLNSLHGVNLRDPLRELGMSLLPVASMNTVSALSAELEGRPYGGGVLKMEPREAERWMVPSPQTVEVCADELIGVQGKAAALLARGDYTDAAALVDEIVLKGACGMDEGELDRARRTLAGLQGRRRERARPARR